MRDTQLRSLRARVAKTAAMVEEPPALPRGSSFGLKNLAPPNQPLPSVIMTPEEDGLNSINLVSVVREAKIGRGLAPLRALYEALKEICIHVSSFSFPLTLSPFSLCPKGVVTSTAFRSRENV